MADDIGSRAVKALRALPLVLAQAGAAAGAARPSAAAAAIPALEAQGAPVEWGRGRFRFSELPEYDDLPEPKPCSITVHRGVPFFSDEDFSGGSCWGVKPPDGLGRARGAYVLVGPDTVRDRSERPSNAGLPAPSGWHDTRYEGLKPANLYDHSHVAAWALTGIFKDPGNLITATTTMNRSGMAPYENRVLRHVRAGAGRHVLYRVTPAFGGRDLVARGVLVEAASLEDRGASLRMCAWCYNVRPGVEIDYATGESRLSAGPAPAADLGEAALTAGLGWAAPLADALAGALDAGPPAPGAAALVAVPGAGEFHAPGCALARGGGSLAVPASRESLIEAGYRPCEACRP